MDKNQFYISTDPELLDMDLIHHSLSDKSYWASGRAYETVVESFRNSLGFGLYRKSDNEMIGFCRVLTDYATVAYILDFFVIEGSRGSGLGKMLIEEVLSHVKLKAVRRFMLATRDAHGFYAQYGFKPIAHPEFFMEKFVDHGTDPCAED